MKKKRNKPYRHKKHSLGLAKLLSAIEIDKFEPLDIRQKQHLEKLFNKLNLALEQGNPTQGDILQLNCYVRFLTVLESYFNNKVSIDEAIKIYSTICETRYNIAYRYVHSDVCQYQDDEQEIILNMWELIKTKLELLTNNDYNQLWNIAVGLDNGHKYDIVGAKTFN